MSLKNIKKIFRPKFDILKFWIIFEPYLKNEQEFGLVPSKFGFSDPKNIKKHQSTEGTSKKILRDHQRPDYSALDSYIWVPGSIPAPVKKPAPLKHEFFMCLL